MQPLNQEIVNDHTKDIGHRSNRHDRELRGQTAAHGEGDRMKDLLTRALEAHGGLSRWREIEAFQLRVSIGGGLWRLKGLPDGLRDVTLRIQAHRPIVTITPFGGEARTGHLTPDRVWIEDAHGGVVEERGKSPASFAGD